LLGKIGENRFIASGHYRNGILLAPATALIMAQTLAGERPAVDLSPFSPLRQEQLKIAQV
jgi:glycine oxidase